MLVTSLQRVDDTENLSCVTPSRGRVRHDKTNSLLWVDNKDRTDGESDSLGVNIGGVLVINPAGIRFSFLSLLNVWPISLGNKHVVGVRNLPLLVSNNREFEVTSRDLVDVLDP